MTVSDLTEGLPVASARPSPQPDRARVSTRPSTRARARLTDTPGSRKILAAAARAARIVVVDVRRWWLVAARPPSLRVWLRVQRPDPARVPAGSGPLRVAWLVDNWSIGLLLRAVSVLLWLAAGALAWLAGHPIRRYSALLITAALAAGIYLSGHPFTP